MNIICLGQTGADASGSQFPLFSKALGYGFSTPVYLYFGVAWTNLFGFSIQSFRSIAAFFTVLTVIGLYLLVCTLVNQRAALFTALAATVGTGGRMCYPCLTG